MKITIVGRKCTPKESFKTHAEEKLAKIDKFFGDDAEAKITASANKNKATVEIMIKRSGMFFRSQDTQADMSDALDNCVDILIRQIRKNKTKVEKQLKNGAFENYLPQDKIEEETEFDVVRHKSTSVKPQSIEEAILQMNMLGHNFYMFQNHETNQINVVYVRHDGGYGVLEPNV